MLKSPLLRFLPVVACVVGVAPTDRKAFGAKMVAGLALSQSTLKVSALMQA